MSELPPLQDIFLQIDANQTTYIDDLKEAVSFASVASDPGQREDVMKMIAWIQERLKKVGAKTELCNVEVHPAEGEKPTAGRKKPPHVLLASVGKSPRKKVLVVYCHLDVHPARAAEWSSDPFVLVERDGILYGRGVSDNKGPVLCWLHLLELYQKIGRDPPVNIRFILDSAEELGSPGLEGLLRDKRKSFLKPVDYACITDGMWIGKNKPCIVYGTRGICYFRLSVKGIENDVNSGKYGGALYEPMGDLIYLLDSFHNKHAKLQLARLDEDIVQPSAENARAFDAMDLDVTALRTQVGASRLLHSEARSRILMHRWCLPSFSLHGIEGAFSEPGGRTVIPGTVTAKFSLRLVPRQSVPQVVECVREHIHNAWRERHSPNIMEVHLEASAEPWMGGTTGIHMQVAQRVMKKVFGADPELVRSGSSIAVASMLKGVATGGVVILPLGGRDDGTHGNDEHLCAKQYISAHKVIASYLNELAALKQ